MNAIGDAALEEISFSDVRITYTGRGTAEEVAREVSQIAAEYFEIGTPPAYAVYDLPDTSGIGIGVIGVLARGSSVDRLLYGVKPSDPDALTGAAVLLAAAALAAAYIPARWATRVDPMRTLHWE